MQISTSTPTITTINQLAHSINFYEQAISIDEDTNSNYWQLGIAYLLSGREEDAQAAWMIPFTTVAESEVDNLTDDLIKILAQAASHQATIPELEQAWLLRQHIKAIAPDRIENVLHLICLAHDIGTLTAGTLTEWQVDEILQLNSSSIDEELLERVISALLTIQTDLSLEIIRSCLHLAVGREFLISKIVATLLQSFNQRSTAAFAIKLTEICNTIQPNDLGVLQVLSYLYSAIGRYQEATAIAEQYYQVAPGIIEKLFGSYQIQRTHFTAGNWQDVSARVNLHRQLLTEIVRISPQDLHQGQCKALLISSFFLPYTEDNPSANKKLQNQLAALCQQNLQSLSIESKFGKSSLQKKSGCLRIGYIASTLTKHSVGWLSRWLIHHHDRESFQLFIYCLNSNHQDEFHDLWFRSKVDVASYFNVSSDEVTAQIRTDKIDILIDLDSLTLDITCLVMAQKPAPVQVSWLGWDSIGIPAVDYFIADPCVLPANAQDYYQEKIWRLPHTYLAVEGFEVGTPTLRREDLDIPDDAITYLSSQSGYKRHPDCVKSQMQIIKAVPNSYFLIKGRSDAATIKNFFGTLATEVGISLDRLRFLSPDIDEETHRANLAIADIVLDTFPYNGATTTLETLWMGIPIVTQVGQQFAARNSYTFMLNAGIEEGIAWSTAEYIEWGIKLGLDRDLRDKIAGKLRSGRATAPVWNAKQFTLDMEQAYRDMWAKYQDQQHQNLN